MSVYHVALSVLGSLLLLSTASVTADPSAPIADSLRITIEHTHSTYQGAYERIDITLENTDLILRSFNLLIGFDTTVMSFRGAVAGTFYDECDWEYFTYSPVTVPPCDTGCPSGLVRLLGIADIDNGDAHPSNQCGDRPLTLASLEFLVTYDRNYECEWTPIRFWWFDCDDNSIAFNSDTASLLQPAKYGVSRRVYEWDPIWYDRRFIEISDNSRSFPNYTGSPNKCLLPDSNQPPQVRSVDFYNGGVKIMGNCEDIDWSGDLNLDGRQQTLEDVILFSKYFVYGRSIFDNYEAQMASSDVNYDGNMAGVDDFVYLTRIAVGDSVSFIYCRDTVDARFRIDDFGLSVEPAKPLGAVLLQFKGNVTMSLIPPQLEMKFRYDDSADLTRCLIYSLAKGVAVNSGPFLTFPYPVNLIHIEAATYPGNPVREVLVNAVGGDPSSLPSSFLLYQNHPNPFNLETVIPFDLPKSGEVTLEIFNALGQSVHRRTAPYPAGNHQFTWNGRTDNGAVASSGIYYYRVSSNDHTQTRKMVLLK